MRTPATEDELAAIVREGRPIRPVGGGTKLTFGPRSDAEPVSLQMFNRITSYEPGDLVVCVQAGARLADVQAELAKHHQWLPIDPPYGDATIGGVLATNSSGPRRLGYGTMRDLLIGLRIMGAEGAITRSGGRVVKNVTGYDLHKLHVGAFGSLGVLLEANFKVRPCPEISAAIVFRCASFPEAHRLLLDIHGLPLRPVALEAVDGRALVGVEGTRKILERHVNELRKLGRPFDVVEDGSAWSEPPRDAVRVRIAAKPHDLPKLVPAGRRVQAHVGNGIARVDFDPAADLPAKIAPWNAAAAAVGGYAVVESAPFDMPDREQLPWGRFDHPLMKAIKDARDPKGQFNPPRQDSGQAGKVAM